jgi:uncharacterized damage-inducible protein DinB
MTSLDPSGQTTPERWVAATVYPDMWVDPDEDPRDTGVELVDERSTLLAYLRSYRLTLRMKCADLDASQMASRSVPPSTMSLLGLIRHMADVERHWFRTAMAGEDASPLFWSDDDPEGGWDGAIGDPIVVAQAWAAWDSEVDSADRFVANASNLDMVGRQPGGGAIRLREVLVHMIEEYARHCGHADLIRERIDGRVGQ